VDEKIPYMPKLIFSWSIYSMRDEILDELKICHQLFYRQEKALAKTRA
jgi:hypothetical protein